MQEITEIESAHFERIIGLIHQRHGVSIGKDDPILIIYTLHDDLIRRIDKSQEEILRRFSSKIEETSNRWQNDAKKKAEQTLTAAVIAATAQISAICNTAIEHQETALNRAVNDAVSKIETTQQTLKYPIYVVIAATIVCLITCIIVLFCH